jgi:hypothetical protein
MIDLKVGGVYASADGIHSKVVAFAECNGELYPFGTNRGRWFTQDGTWNLGLDSAYDLVTVISEPTEKLAVAGVDKKVVSVDIYVTEEDGTEKIYNLDHKDGIIGLYCETYGVDMTPEAARAIAEEMFKMAGNKV